jgi:hypothetical protein
MCCVELLAAPPAPCLYTSRITCEARAGLRGGSKPASGSRFFAGVPASIAAASGGPYKGGRTGAAQEAAARSMAQAGWLSEHRHKPGNGHSINPC